MPTTTKESKNAQRDEAREMLRGMLPPGSTVRTILRHVSRSGMTRAISPIVDGEDVTWLALRAVPGWKRDERHDGIKLGGCGMDMGFELVYVLSRSLYPEGHACTCSDWCPSNDHSNGDRDYTPHNHTDGGYALRQAWL